MFSRDLHRFHTAQAAAEGGYESALAEVRGAGKRTHWIWYIFPQLSGLGQSPEARRYGLASRAEAQAYLQDPLLHSNLLEITRTVAEELEKGASLLKLLGSPIDALKLVSSLTLFEQIGRELQTEQANAECAALASVAQAEYAALVSVAQRVLDAASAQGYPRCALTQRALSD